MISRRELVKGGLAALGFSALPKFAALAELTSKGRSYSVPVLGDIHFDSPDPKFYHAGYTHSTSAKRYKAHLAEHVRNSEMWKDRLPRLVGASSRCIRADTAFALQMGDLVQGDCGNAAMHRQMLDDAFGLVKGAYGGKMPLVVASGNHDIRGDMKGDGARETLEKWLPETMAKELGVPVKGTTFSFRQGPDVFIVVDFNEPRPNLATIKRLLEESKDARYTFIVSHGPVIPSGQTRWFLMGGKTRDVERKELRSLFARRNAICLCGHTEGGRAERGRRARCREARRHRDQRPLPASRSAGQEERLERRLPLYGGDERGHCASRRRLRSRGGGSCAAMRFRRHPPGDRICQGG